MNPHGWKLAAGIPHKGRILVALEHDARPGDIWMSAPDLERLSDYVGLHAELRASPLVEQQTVEADPGRALWEEAGTTFYRALSVWNVSGVADYWRERIEDGRDQSGRAASAVEAVEALLAELFDDDLESGILRDDAELRGAPLRIIDGRRCVAVSHIRQPFEDRAELAAELRELGADITPLYKRSGASSRWVAIDDLARVADTRLLREIEALPDPPDRSAACDVWQRERPALEDIEIEPPKASTPTPPRHRESSAPLSLPTREERRELALAREADLREEGRVAIEKARALGVLPGQDERREVVDDMIERGDVVASDVDPELIANEVILEEVSEDLDPLEEAIGVAPAVSEDAASEASPASNVVEIRRRPAEAVDETNEAARVRRPPIKIDRRLIDGVRAPIPPLTPVADRQADPAAQVFAGLRAMIAEAAEQQRPDHARIEALEGRNHALANHCQRLELRVSQLEDVINGLRGALGLAEKRDVG